MSQLRLYDQLRLFASRLRNAGFMGELLAGQVRYDRLAIDVAAPCFGGMRLNINSENNCHYADETDGSASQFERFLAHHRLQNVDTDWFGDL